MGDLYMAISHGCAAGFHREMFENIYWKRIQRMEISGQEYYSTETLNAFGSDLAALIGFFEQITLFDGPFERPVTTLLEHRHPFVLSQASIALRSLGRLTEALDPLWASFRLREKNGDVAGATVAAVNLSEMLLLRGRLHEAHDAAQRARDLAEKTKNNFMVMVFSRLTICRSLLI